MKTNKSKIISYVLICAIILVTAVLGSVFVNLGQEWFKGLTRPSEFPPDELIPIMWSLIYIIFTIVLLRWVSKTEFSGLTIFLLIANAVFNILWCLLFFTLNSTIWGLVSIVILQILSWMLFVNISKYNKVYAIITSIYPFWLTFATCLNMAIWILN